MKITNRSKKVVIKSAYEILREEIVSRHKQISEAIYATPLDKNPLIDAQQKLEEIIYSALKDETTALQRNFGSGWAAFPSKGVGEAARAVIADLVTLRISYTATANTAIHETRSDKTAWEKYGSKSYPRTVGYIVTYFSAEKEGAWARIIDDELIIDDLKPLPKGFIRAGNEITRARDGMDYHCYAEDLLLPTKSQAKMFHDEMDRNMAARKAAEVALKEEEKKNEETRKAAATALKEDFKRLQRTASGLRTLVTLEDSKNAGNCSTGTAEFVKKHQTILVLKIPKSGNPGYTIKSCIEAAKADPAKSKMIRAAIITAKIRAEKIKIAQKL